MEIKEPKILDLISKSEKKELVLPNFQRDFVWDIKKQKVLLSSFFTGLPSGNILSIQGDASDYDSRSVCFNASVKPAIKCSFLLDGQQRFSVLKNAFFNLYNDDLPSSWQSQWSIIFEKLRNRFFINVDPENTELDFFGYKSMIFDKSIFSKIDPEELEQFIEAKNITEKNQNQYYHPGYEPIDKKGKKMPAQARRIKICEEMSSEGLVPLFELYAGGSNSLHNKTLTKIAEIRTAQMKSDLIEKDKICVLKTVEDNIEDFFKKKKSSEIDKAWMKLEAKWVNSVTTFLESLLHNKLLEIELDRSETKRAYAIFEAINLPGTPLSDYDLIVARAARNTKQKHLTQFLIAELQKQHKLPLSLTSKINGAKPNNSKPSEFGCITKSNELTKEIKIRFLQMLTIISKCKLAQKKEVLSIDHLKRKKFLDLNEAEINKNSVFAINALIRAIEFLRYRCGIQTLEEVPYKLMILPIANIFFDEKNWKNEKVLNKVEYWYWVSIFSGEYQMDQNEKAKEDIINLEKFIKGSDPKSHIFSTKRHKSIFKIANYCDEETLLCKESESQTPSAIHTTILNYILSNQPYDFTTDLKGGNVRLNSWSDFKLEDHHICPLVSKKTMNSTSTTQIRKDKKEILNSPINRTFISKEANRKIGAFDPTEYFKYVSDFAKYGHCVAMPFEKKYTKKSNESEDDFYLRVCEERYHSFYNKINEELYELID